MARTKQTACQAVMAATGQTSRKAVSGKMPRKKIAIKASRKGKKVKMSKNRPPRSTTRRYRLKPGSM